MERPNEQGKHDQTLEGLEIYQVAGAFRKAMYGVAKRAGVQDTSRCDELDEVVSDRFNISTLQRFNE